MTGSAQMPTVPPPKQEKPVPASDEESSQEWDEFERLVAWEFLCFLDLGFTVEETQRLIVVPHISWHDADDLIKAHPTWPLAVVTDELT